MTAPLPTLSALGRAAVAYARQGWLVFPLRPRDKRPFANADYGVAAGELGGFTVATRQVEVVRRWWKRWPDANIGCRPGPSGFVVLDLDGPEGEAAAAAAGLLSEPTLEVVTGRDDGGRHRWYKHPGGFIGNAALAPKLDVRADTGYVVLPPSVHPSGRRYTWAGRVEEVVALPPAIAEQLQSAGRTGEPVATGAVPAREIASLPVIGEGGRNQTLAREAGRLLALGHAVDEATHLCLALNAAKCRPPLPDSEVVAIVQSIARKEARKPGRVTPTGVVLSTVESGPDVEPPESFGDLARQQVTAAVERGRRDYSDAPRWFSQDLHSRIGMMLPGELHVVGALTGNGKTSFLLSQMEYAAARGITTLYLPLELDPDTLRRQWAAWQLGYEWVHVARNEWERLPAGARDRHEAVLREQLANPHVHFPPDRRVSVSGLAAWMQRGVEELGARIVIVDHFHRMDFGTTSQNFRVAVTDAVRTMKDLAREHGVALIVAAQLNQDGDKLDRYFPPVLRRLKESAGIGEEADVVLMLSRRLKQDLSTQDAQAVRLGHSDIRQYEDPGVMIAMCRKHRLDDSARDRAVLLNVHHGKVSDRARSWVEQTPERGDAWVEWENDE